MSNFGTPQHSLKPASTQTLPIPHSLTSLLPSGIPKGITASTNSASIVLALLAECTRQGLWAAIAGFSNLGLLAGREMGLEFSRCALVKNVNGRAVAVIAALIDAVDLLIIDRAINNECISSSNVRKLVARAREQRTTLLLHQVQWVEIPSLQLTVSKRTCYGISQNHGHIVRRYLHVESSGRRQFSQAKSADICITDTSTASADIAITSSIAADTAIAHEQRLVS